MLLKVNRLKKNKDFERVFKKGQIFKEDFLVLKIFPNNLKSSRFGFIVSQKVSKKAVLRNKIKRWLKAAILSQLKNGAKIQKPADIVIIVRPGARIKDFPEIKEIIKKIFNRYGILN